MQANKKAFRFRAGSQQRKLKLENIIDICDSALGYDVMLIVGACADIIESLFGRQLLADSVRELQLALRIGLSHNIAKELYAIGLADRVVALAVADRIAKSEREVSEHGKN